MAADLRDPVRSALDAVLGTVREVHGGAVASYIPELAKADPDALGVALVSTRGMLHDAGDAGAEFTIQSVSKPFAFALAVDTFGIDEVTKHVGLEPSGEPFNAISLEPATGRPLNPMINAGAIVITSLLGGPDADADAKAAVVRTGLERFAGRDLVLAQDVYASEASTGDRNRALAYLTRSAGTLGATAEIATDAYFRQCSLLVTARDLAIMAATLANGGVNPVSGERVVGKDAARWTTAVMTSCGMYDASGTWLVHVGLPAKSGVGGGIVALQPGQFGIGTFSPPLDAQGNSVRGVAMLQELSTRFDLHMLEHRGAQLSPIASLERSDVGGETVAVLRGDLKFAGAEEVLTRLAPLVGDDGCLVLDFSAVTRVAEGARRVLSGVPERVGLTADGRPRVVIRDPEGVLERRDPA
ncbi:glutaminase A [Agromyces sp. MMS24-K17]|uniref:glutaminase A n=1 Tax=Agromyces sp. MMS24-K17 TaxID=3372850 RepID=UPI003754813B